MYKIAILGFLVFFKAFAGEDGLLELSTENVRLVGTVNDLKHKILHLESHNEQLESACHELRMDNESKDKEIFKLTSESVQLKNRNSSLEKEFYQLKGQLSAIQELYASMMQAVRPIPRKNSSTVFDDDGN